MDSDGSGHTGQAFGLQGVGSLPGARSRRPGVAAPSLRWLAGPLRWVHIPTFYFLFSTPEVWPDTPPQPHLLAVRQVLVRSGVGGVGREGAVQERQRGHDGPVQARGSHQHVVVVEAVALGVDDAVQRAAAAARQAGAGRGAGGGVDVARAVVSA